MKRREGIKNIIIAVMLFLGVCWSLAAASREAPTNGYPNGALLASAEWLQQHIDDGDLVVLDVRTDEYFDGERIPGAIRLPWRIFRYHNTALHVGSVFVGLERSQQILGHHGVLPSDTIVLYDSVERDGGATSSYVFWILDMLGHANKKVLNGGIDAWKAAGGRVVQEAVEPEPLLYQADPEAIRARRWADGAYIQSRLSDPYYQIIDVRSHAEYVGDTGNTDLNGNPLKLGHIPTAINIEYKRAWIDEETKQIKPYAQLQALYRGVDPNKATVVYCHSGRRSSFSYFILRLMGFHDVIEYEGSWNEWGSPRNFFPTELNENQPAGDALPGSGPAASSAARSSKRTDPTDTNGERTSGGAAKSADVGYISCGG